MLSQEVLYALRRLGKLPDLAGFGCSFAPRKSARLKFVITLFLFFFLAAPALAKPRDVYPVPCNDLWAAVNLTLSDSHNYGIMSVNDVQQKASFIVIGNLITYTDIVALTATNGGCAMKATILEAGSDNPDWRQFHHRLAQSLAKLQAAKPKPSAAATGQQ